MKKLLFLFAFALILANAFAQSSNVTGVCVGNGAPNGAGRNITNQTQLIECSVYKDTTTNTIWVYDNSLAAPNRWVVANREIISTPWIEAQNIGTSVQIALAQNGATTGQAPVWNGSGWVPTTISGGTTYTAGSGIDITSNVISAVDASTTNEGSLTVQAGTATTSIIASNTAGSTPVTVAAGSGITLSEAGSTITISSTAAPDTPLPVYVSNAAAVAALGTGKRYRLGFGSTEGAVGTVKETY